MKFENSLADYKSKVLSIEELFFSHFNELCFYCYTYVSDMEIAKDIVQEAFLSLWLNRDSYAPTRALLYTFVKNKAVDHLREKNRNKCKLQINALNSYVNELIINQEDYLALADLSKQIDESIDQLPPQCKKIFEMSRFQYMKNREIAEELDISIKTVEKQITKALSFIHKRLHKAGLYCLFLIFHIFF